MDIKFSKILLQRYSYLGNMLEGSQRSAGHSLNTTGLVLASEHGIFFLSTTNRCKGPHVEAEYSGTEHASRCPCDST